MPQPAFARVAELFNAAVALPVPQRSAFLAAACAGDADLRAAVETLLRHDADDTDLFHAGPAAREAAEARQDVPTLPAPNTGDGAGPLPNVPGYELLRELGRGGMGVVYLARHVGLKRLVALKMLPATQATPELIARFRTEAEALARLQHPNIVPIYDVGEFEGHPYFTMEYVAGPSLAAVLDGRPQDVPASVRLVEDVARAAHAVHQCGIVHRDLKPANVLLQAPGLQQGGFANPKITDFGIAMDLNAANRLTQAGVIMGTPSYMAPEQVRNTRGGVGPAADIYALGSILYELLTGRPPFDAPTPLETIAQLVNQEPLSPSRLRPRLPDDLVTICLKCLEKSPRRRYATAWDLAEDLRRFRADEPILAHPVGPVGRAYRWCLRRPLVAGLMALCAALAVAFVVTVVVYDAKLRAALATTTKTAEEERQQIVQLNLSIGFAEEEHGDNFTAVLRFAEALRLDEADSANGREHRARIAAALRTVPRLLRMRTHEGRVISTLRTRSGGWVATAGADRGIRVWEALTDQPRGPALNADEEVSHAALGDDGQLLATVGHSEAVRVWDVLTGSSRALPLKGEPVVRRVAFPGGGRVLLTEHADASIRRWDLAKSEPAPLMGPWADAVACSGLSEDGHWLFTQDGMHRGQVWDMTDGKASGSPLRLEPAAAQATVSRDGRRVALVSADGSLRVWDLATGSVGEPMRPRRGFSHLAFSPDGSRVITSGTRQAAQVWEVQTGDGFDILSHDGGTTSCAGFSSNGQFLIAADGTRARVWDLSTGRPVTPSLRHATPVVAAACNADASRVVTVSQAGTVREWELPRPPELGGDSSSTWDLASEDHSSGEIVVWLQVLACSRINNKQQHEAMNERDLLAAWDALTKGRGRTP